MEITPTSVMSLRCCHATRKARTRYAAAGNGAGHRRGANDLEVIALPHDRQCDALKKYNRRSH